MGKKSANANASANASANANAAPRNANSGNSGAVPRNASSGSAAANSGAYGNSGAAGARAGRVKREPMPAESFNCMVGYYDKYRSDCAAKKSCPLVQACQEFGVGTSLWPVTTYRHSDDEFEKLKQTPEFASGKINLGKGRRCMNDTMWSDPGFLQGFQGHIAANCPTDQHIAAMLEDRQRRNLEKQQQQQQQQQQQGNAGAAGNASMSTLWPKKAAAPKKKTAAPKKKPSASASAAPKKKKPSAAKK